jgi:two-component system response regulator NreC
MAGHLHLAQFPGDPPQAESQIRVVLADNHAAARRSLRLLLDAEERIDVIAEAADISTVMRHVHAHLPHVLVLDLRTPNGSSIEAIRRLRAQVPGTEIVVLTMEESPAFARQAIDAGAIGFVLKDTADAELMTAVRRARAGDEYVSPRVEAALEALRKVTTGDGLSVRETEVLPRQPR